MKGIKRIVATVVCGALLCSTVAFSACSGAANGQRYMVTYELNYEGADAREMSVAEGKQAYQWRAYRDGYELEGWYTDSACTQRYDFTQAVKGDCTLYANWTVKKGFVELTFDYDYVGRINSTVSVKANEPIPEKAYPLVSDRIGMEFKGWYKDKEKTKLWDEASDVPTDTTTLYARYDIDNSWVIRESENGPVKYENVEIEVVCRQIADFDVLSQLTAEFNELYKGKITATAVNRLDVFNDNEKGFLILDRTLSMEANMYYWDFYYNTADIFTAAGVDLGLDNFCENSINDVFVDGYIKGYPIAAQTPYMLYSKTLMEKYWGCIGNKLPTNYTEFTTLMRAAYAGESRTNSQFRSILQWDGEFNYINCTIPMVQNGAEFYRVEGDKTVCDWEEPATAERVKTALNNFYDVFGKNGTCHGNPYGSDRLGALKNGNALFAIIGLSNKDNVASVAAESDSIGVMSVAGLYSDNEYRNNVPLMPLTVSFWKDATRVGPTQMCASAVFAKYLADNADRFADSGLVPLQKTAYNRFTQKTTANAKVLQQAIKPENFYTCDGSKKDWFVRRDVVAPDMVIYMNSDGTNTYSMYMQLYSEILGKIV